MPPGLRRRLGPIHRRYARWRGSRPPRLGDLRRVTPIDPRWGFDRGTPIDRVYVERFLAEHARDIRGRVLEIGAPDYTNRFGSSVERVEILHAGEGNPHATIVGDLADAPYVASESFDCAVVTQTLQLVFDVRAALQTLHRILAPGGVLLVTVPGITKIAAPENEIWGDWWRFTAKSLRRLGAEAFGEENVHARSYGNVLAATAFLYGLAASDLERGELDFHDPLYEVTVALRAVRRASPRSAT